jgi:hypothetical protein
MPIPFEFLRSHAKAVGKTSKEAEELLFNGCAWEEALFEAGVTNLEDLVILAAARADVPVGEFLKEWGRLKGGAKHVFQE